MGLENNDENKVGSLLENFGGHQGRYLSQSLGILTHVFLKLLMTLPDGWNSYRQSNEVRNVFMGSLLNVHSRFHDTPQSFMNTSKDLRALINNAKGA